MKTLDTLIRLHKRTLDELRRGMVDLENQKTQLQKAIVTLQEELDREVSMAKTRPEMAGFFGDFSKRIKNRQEDMRKEIVLLDGKIAKLNNEIFVAFTDLKKCEIAKENAKIRAAEKQKRKETIELDEIAAQQFRMKNLSE